jgi:4-hydroxy-tetrahydrodipicolinate synthase
MGDSGRNLKTHLDYRRERRGPEEIVALLLKHHFEGSDGPVLIAVGGPGGTGKSTFCRALQNRLEDASILTLDDYKTDRVLRENRMLFGAHPEANRIDVLREHLSLVRRGKSIDHPRYNNATGRADHTEPFTPSRFVILDGEISTYPHFREFTDFSIFIDSDWRTQLATRISRDIEQRGYTREKAIATFLQSNLREFEEFGAASKGWADMHLYCRDDYRLVVESVDADLFERYRTLLEVDLERVRIDGSIVPITTPFTAEGSIDKKAFIEHCEFLARRGVEKLLVNGTTGEFFSLLGEERKQLLELAVRYFPGVVLFQAGADSLAQTLRQTAWAEEYGADAVVVIVPYYFANAPARGIVDYFHYVAESTSLPLLPYNFPRHTGNPLTADILSKIEHFGLKDSSGDLSLIGSTPRYFIGSDRKILAAHQAGARGFISAQSNHTPERYVAMEKALADGNLERAKQLQQEITSTAEAFSGVSQIARVKRAIAGRLAGYPVSVRPPLG